MSSIPYSVGRLNHLEIKAPSATYSAVVTWYLTALAPLGFKTFMEFPDITTGMTSNGKQGEFWVSKSKDDTNITRGMHLAFTADTREQVREFYRLAIEAGAKDNGAPGIRTQYHENYYGAFVVDLMGNNIEVVDHKPYPDGEKA